ncbi:MAG: TIGR00341 family protein [Sulfurovum sp.]|nr:TIGR00341 family protein [Sulfurovum sp.]NNJ45159.1 TIGR00341 family protein [Sulfurovum sp.]
MIYYIYSPHDVGFVQTCKVHLTQRSVTYLSLDDLDTLDANSVSHLLVSGCLDEIKTLLAFAHKHTLSVGIIPRPEQKELMRTFSLPAKLEDAISLALTPTDKKLDLLYCNDTIVLQEVVVGDAPPLDQFESILNGKNLFDRVKLFWRTMVKVHDLKHTQMKITDAKENEIKLSAVGVVGVEYSNETFAAKLVSDGLSASDGKMVIVILSPISVVQYMGYLFKSLVSHIKPTSLPGSVGYIKSSKIHIETKVALDVVVDSTTVVKTPVSLVCANKALALSVGEKFWEKQNSKPTSKDSIKIEHLPNDDESANYLSQSIPLFSHASQAQYTSLFSNLREESKLSTSFMVLLILATMIATFGLFINSSSVIIGAMLLAPLMQPIVSLSMGVLRQDNSLQIDGMKTIFIGVLAVLFTAAVISVFTPIERLTTEMSGRLSPTILDLFVAIVSGTAAAYAKSNEKILGSLAGVAIAVALVPPIAVAGIGLGWADWHMFASAFLLFVTNLVGIVLAAAFTFVLLGFSPLHVAKKGIMLWMFIVAIVSVPLYSSFITMQEDIRIQKMLSNLAFSLGEQDIKLTQIELIHRKNIDEIHCEVISTGILKKEEKLYLKEAILKSIDKKADVIATFRYRL